MTTAFIDNETTDYRYDVDPECMTCGDLLTREEEQWGVCTWCFNGDDIEDIYHDDIDDIELDEEALTWLAGTI